MTDEEILASCSAGDAAAFSLLYQRYAQRGRNYAYSVLQHTGDAEELVQEAFCKLLAPLSRGQLRCEGGGFAALFFRTLRNLAIDAVRRRRHRTLVSLDVAGEPSTAADPRDLRGVDAALEELMEGLPRHHRDALELRVHSRLDYRQIAQVLECSVAQVRTWIHRARRQLAAGLRARGFLDEGERP